MPNGCKYNKLLFYNVLFHGPLERKFQRINVGPSQLQEGLPALWHLPIALSKYLKNLKKRVKSLKNSGDCNLIMLVYYLVLIQLSAP
ncbi:MAG TPA: hypothetical protein DIS76_05605 [Rhodospirillaceae bacterium]|nr:hypothetical protein [Rhodospirillaceae bacterium]